MESADGVARMSYEMIIGARDLVLEEDRSYAVWALTMLSPHNDWIKANRKGIVVVIKNIWNDMSVKSEWFDLVRVA